jgi:hypothetical protein
MRSMLRGASLLAALAGCQPKNQSTPAPVGQPVKATVHEVLSGGNLRGQMVEVTGTCLGYSAPTIARGSPPLTRSDWQLEDQGEAVWVSGPLPEGCTATTPATGPGSITALVAEDTLPGLGGGAPSPRRYLVRSS